MPSDPVMKMLRRQPRRNPSSVPMPRKTQPFVEQKIPKAEAVQPGCKRQYNSREALPWIYPANRYV